jgi:ParB family chromosome partitioning protein
MAEQEPAKRRALGKGLESLLPRSLSPRILEVASIESPGTAQEIPLDSIDRSPFQTRTRFNEKQLAELAASIAASGVVQPALVRPLADGRYQLIAGERRWLASRLAGKTTIPAIVRQISDGQAMEITIVENLQRSDLNPIEQARAYERLSREFKLTQEQMALRTGKDRASVANFLRLLRLPAEVQSRVEAEELSFGHARALLALEDPDSILRATQKVCALAMSVRQTESYVQGILDPEKKAQRERDKVKQPLDPNVREARDELQRSLGLRVTIEDKQGRGRVIIEYSGLEDFDGLMERLVR